MSAVRDQIATSLADSAWDRLSSLDADHQVIQRLHEQLRRRLDESIMAKDEVNLRAAWKDYREAVASLDKITEDLETLRLTAG